MCVGQRESRWCCCPLLMNMMACFIQLVIKKYIHYICSLYVCACIYLLRGWWLLLIRFSGGNILSRYHLCFIAPSPYHYLSTHLTKLYSISIALFLPRLLALSLTDRNIWLEKWIYKNVDIHISLLPIIFVSFILRYVFHCVVLCAYTCMIEE